ncbi:hypothetical protein RR48_02767 [Papilio machaon]|uniref:Uncharacterized protein n=1 Tax=Papilio machaon TaxID=76193 RepID=A0A0N0PE49_PAPMA|nr:hypothetical protein RR48_02767 [Papilio machaon]
MTDYYCLLYNTNICNTSFDLRAYPENTHVPRARRTTDVSNKRKRFISVLSLALSYNALSDIPTTLQRVQEAVTRTRAQLNKTADAIGGETSASLALIRAAIDQPINDIKVSCLPNTEEDECMHKLKMYREKNYEHCFEYDRNLELYEKSKEYFNNPQLIDFYKDITEISDSNDEVALSMQAIGRTILTILTLLVVCYNAEKAARNDQCGKNNLMLKNLDAFYLMLPVTTIEARVKSKRFVAVLSSALIYYSKSNATEKIDRVREAVNKTKEELNQSGDALAGQMRAYLTHLRDVISQPINDVKASCSPKTTQSDCEDALKKCHKMNKEKCSDYDRNLDLYQKSRHFFAGDEFGRFVKTLPEVFENGDEMALAFFVDMVLVEFIDLVIEGRNLYRMLTYNSYSCYVSPVGLL